MMKSTSAILQRAPALPLSNAVVYDWLG